MSGDPWAYIGGLREDLGRAEERIHELEAARQAGADALAQAVGGVWAELAPALERIRELEERIVDLENADIDGGES